MNIINEKEIEKNGVNEALLARHYCDKELQHCNIATNIDNEANKNITIKQNS